MLPAEKALVERLKDKPFALIGVNSDPVEKAKAGIAREGITWRNALEGSTSGPLPTDWHVQSWPTLYVMDAKGVIRYKGWEEAEMVATVENLLAMMEAEKGEQR